MQKRGQFVVVCTGAESAIHGTVNRAKKMHSGFQSKRTIVNTTGKIHRKQITSGRELGMKTKNSQKYIVYLWPRALIEGLSPPGWCPIGGFVRDFRSIQHS